MSNIRELVAYAIAKGDLRQDPNEETCADAIGALARADALGAALWRVIGNMDAQAFIVARERLIERLNNSDIPTTRGELYAVAQKSLEEWLAVQCETCGGRRFVVNEEDGVRKTCNMCAGTGRGRYTPDERIKALKIGKATYARLSSFFDEAHRLLNQADARVERQIAYQLERRKQKKT